MEIIKLWNHDSNMEPVPCYQNQCWWQWWL